MFLFTAIFIILYYFKHQQAVADYPALVCQYNGLKYQCVTHIYNHTEGKGLHPDICLKEEDCQSCVKQWITKAKIPDHHQPHIWVSPQHFTVRQRDDSTGLGTRYACSDSVGECACQLQNCTGTAKYCQQNECHNATKCFCTPVSTYNILYLLHKRAEYANVPLISFVICKYRIPSKVKIVGLPMRRLLSDESAAFIEQDVTVRFNDPIITVSTAGTVVIRKDGLERVFAMSDPLGQIVVPEELLLDSGNLKIIFVTTRGETVTGSVKIEGRKFCTRLTCLLCIQVWYQLNCLPPVIRYVLYIGLIIITILLVLYINKVVKVIWQTGVGIYYMGRKLIRLCKTVGRFSLLTGLVAGGSTQRLLDNARLGMEDRARRLAQNAQPHQQRLPLTTILVFFTLISTEPVHAECTNHLVLKTEVKDCRQSKSGQHCKITTNAQITLLNLEYSQCIWFTDRENNNLFRIKLTFQEVDCTWATTRIYYTFPVQLHQLNQISCPQNEQCGWGKHCHRNKHFTALTKESLQYPGITDCYAPDAASLCMIVDSQPCHFYRVWLEPDYNYSYEVRRITSMSCKYRIGI